MRPAGETELAAILQGLDVVRRPGVFVYVVRPPRAVAPTAAVAMVDEGASITYVVPEDSREVSPDETASSFRAAWLTITVQSSLDAVGLTAVVAAALGEASLPVNVMAGFHHDHLLVPVELADRAIEAVKALRSPATGQ